MEQNFSSSNIPSSGDYALELYNLCKVFGQVVANKNINLKVKKGSIHGIIGENGAGKSTAMKMLYGIYSPTSGVMKVEGKEVGWDSPSEAISAGIGMVHQHFMLAGPYNVLDNIILGAEPLKRPNLGESIAVIDRKEARAKLTKLSEHYSMPIDLDAKIEELPVGVQQRIEILKLLYREADILILDEPTAVLNPIEILELFTNLKKMRDEGKTILIITHKLKEVLELTDHVTVFRQGEVVGEIKTSEANQEILAEMMVGRKVGLKASKTYKKNDSAPLFKVDGLTLEDSEAPRPLLNNVNFVIRPGEIVGIAGVEGNGQSDLLHLLIAPDKYKFKGDIFFQDKSVKASSTSQLKKLGIGIIPEDRHKEGLMLDRPLFENFMLGHEELYTRFGLIQKKKLRERSASLIHDYDVRPANMDLMARGLSGGNQQKLIVGREFSVRPKLLFISQPTRGVDVGAIEFIHKELLKAASEGMGILLISSELDEVLGLSDRVLVMYEGKIQSEFSSPPFIEKEIGIAMGGGH